MLKTLASWVIAAFMALGLNSVSWAQSSNEEISALLQPTEQEMKNQCALIGNLTFLAIEKFNKGRKLDEVNEELAGVVDTAFNKQEFAAYSDQLRERYNAAMLDAFLNEGLNPKVVAKKQIRDCVRKIP
ncbi:MAG: hypothetical protein ACPHFQ_10605 [Paracoccaceae bacterium]|jgi:hypothetical protein|nr:hypothetical protein [Paracoccaceae bacterium]